MTQREINEIKRRLTLERNNISRVYGCFINKNKEKISTIDASLGIISHTETEQYLSLFKKTLSGHTGRNLIDIELATDFVTNSDEHRLLMRNLDTAFEDEEARNKLFDTIIDGLTLEDSNYVVLLCLDKYDVPTRTSDALEGGEKESDTIFTYMICCVCPVNEGKTALGYVPADKEFHSCTSPQIIGKPEMGFMFPSFDDRRSNIYNALLYTKDIANLHSGFIGTLFKTEPPMSAPEQKQTFSQVLAEVLEKDLSFDVVQSVHEQVREMVEEHNEQKKHEPLDFTANDVAVILKGNGIAEEKVEEFKSKCTESFGNSPSLNPTNIIDIKKFEVATPQVKITVDPEYTYTLDTKVIEGVKYILIPAEDGVTINGVNVNIERESEQADKAEE